jgi:hypothetical protein
MRILHLKYNILHNFFYPCLLLDGLLAVVWHLHFHYDRDSGKPVHVSHTILIKKVVRWSTMRVHDVTDESAVYYPNHEHSKLIA